MAKKDQGGLLGRARRGLGNRGRMIDDYVDEAVNPKPKPKPKDKKPPRKKPTGY